MSCVIYDLETMNLSTTCIAKEEMELESTLRNSTAEKYADKDASTRNIEHKRI